jgi:hypothetical protein
LAAAAAQRYATEATEIAFGLQSAHVDADGHISVPTGTVARTRKARALASLIVDLTTEGA